MNGSLDPQHLGRASASALAPAVPDYPHNIDKEVTIKGK